MTLADETIDAATFAATSFYAERIRQHLVSVVPKEFQPGHRITL
jgi:hypothetical protein